MLSSKNTSEFKESKYEYPTNVATHTYVSKVKKRNPSPPHVEKVVTVIPTVVEHIAHQPRSRHIDVLQSRLEEIAKSVPSIEPLQQQIGEIRDKLSVPHKDHSPDIQALKSRLEEIARSVPSVAYIKQQIDKLAVPHPDIQALKSRIDAMSNNTYSLVEKDGIVRVGPEFNMPSLPPVKGKAGVWEHAPPTFAVNGGMILHNPGFKDKFDPKDHAYLAIDKRTGQVFMSKD